MHERNKHENYILKNNLALKVYTLALRGSKLGPTRGKTVMWNQLHTLLYVGHKKLWEYYVITHAGLAGVYTCMFSMKVESNLMLSKSLETIYCYLMHLPCYETVQKENYFLFCSILET